MSFPFRKTNVRGGVARKRQPSLWPPYSAPTLVKEFGAIDYVDFSPAEPHYFAVTCSVRVQVYNPITRQVVKNLSRFREAAYGGAFRSDGKLIVAGGDESLVRLFDVQSKSLLRLFSGHEAPVHRTYFTQKQTNIVSFSDDRSVRIWDIATEANVSTFKEHDDYIRAGAASPVSPDIILSGGYDGVVKMYDARTGKSTFTVNHESPVEATLFLPTGGIFLSCGGTEIKVWDAFAGGKLLASFSQHHKTVTCLCLATEGKRLMSGSLDRHVKIYDLSTFKTIHTLDYPNAILSMGISQNDETLVVGTVDGMISIKRKEQIKVKESEKTTTTARVPAHIDQVVPQQKREKMARYDMHIMKFQYSKALDVVLASYVSTKTPEITVSVLQELIRRNALHSALAGREEKSLIAMLKFLIKNVGDARFTGTLLKTGNVLMDLYGDSVGSLPSGAIKYFKLFENQLREEIEIAKDMASLDGIFHLILASSAADKNLETEDELPTYRTPSANADKNFVINVS